MTAPTRWSEPTSDLDEIAAAVENGVTVQVSYADHGQPDAWMLATRQDRASIAHWLGRGERFRIKQDTPVPGGGQ